MKKIFKISGIEIKFESLNAAMLYAIKDASAQGARMFGRKNINNTKLITTDIGKKYLIYEEVEA